MSTDLVILGASAYPEIAELIRDINGAGGDFSVRCLLDDDPSWRGREVEGVPVAGGLDLVSQYPDAKFVMGIGSHRTRLIRHDILVRLNLSDDRWQTLVHPAAKVYSTATIGAGSIVHFGSVIANGARLGRWVIVLWNSVIGANALIGDGAMFTSNVTLNAGVKVGPYGFIGSASALADTVTVGPCAMVGMGSLVLRDVPSGVFQFGMPPRILSREDVPADIEAHWNEIKESS